MANVPNPAGPTTGGMNGRADMQAQISGPLPLGVLARMRELQTAVNGALAQRDSYVQGWRDGQGWGKGALSVDLDNGQFAFRPEG